MLAWAQENPPGYYLGLELAGVERTDRGYVKVNERLETTAPGVWAIGEVAGSPQFTHIAYDDFRVIRNNLAGGHHVTAGRQVPFTMFTDPELARAGLSEKEAEQQGIPDRLFKIPMASVLHTRTLSETRGFMKALVAGNDRILGFTVFGKGGGEIMSAVQIAMIAGLPYTALRDAILTHPTLTEGLIALFSSAPMEHPVRVTGRMSEPKGEAMKAYVVETAGGPFRIVEIPTPPAAPGHVLVKISASGVNPLDTKIRAGEGAHAKQPLPAVLGMDMAGVVVDVGAGVTAFQPGDEVFGMVGGVGGLQGTLADFILADAALLAHKPKALSMRQSAALPLVVITAWEGLVDRAQVHAGQTVLVHAGAGGVGFAAVQIGLALGAKVYTTVSEDRRSTVQALGAIAIDRNASVNDYVSEHTAGEGFDIVYDTLGGAVLDASFAAVKHSTGHVVSCLGWGSHSLAPLSFRAATYSGVFTLLPLLTGIGRANHGHILQQAADIADRGQLKPLLAETHFGPDNIAGAYDAVAQGSRGKVVLEL